MPPTTVAATASSGHVGRRVVTRVTDDVVRDGFVPEQPRAAVPAPLTPPPTLAASSVEPLRPELGPGPADRGCAASDGEGAR
ncbi:hypothetical protein [Nocardioides litoris]|uniref:hypothetical protein n=1 Tax=Nocardioides litoris TaxID=1926648 RepID=UPI00111DAE1A|nr:hypothetical protein [Nocardioides litoris]